MLDLDTIRAETPSCEQLTHFNNAGASIMPEPVYRAVTGHLALERAIGGYEAANQEQSKLDSFYTAFASLLNAQPDEIAFIENATRAWDMAVYAIPWKAGDRVLVHQSEYASNYLALLQLARMWSITIDQVPSAPDGSIDLEQLEAMIQPATRAIFLTHIPSQSGLINPAADVGAIARRHQLLYVLDACQSVGQIPVDVQQLNCHILTGTGRKFLRGPRGTGFLYVNKTLLKSLQPPFIDLHAAAWVDDNNYQLRDDARRFENWECFTAGKIGLAEAARYAMALGLDAIQQRVFLLADTLRNALQQLPGIRVQDPGNQHCGIVTFSSDTTNAEQLITRLRQAGINTSLVMHKNARLDLQQRNISSAVRASLHYFNTVEEIENFCRVVALKVTPKTKPKAIPKGAHKP